MDKENLCQNCTAVPFRTYIVLINQGILFSAFKRFNQESINDAM